LTKGDCRRPRYGNRFTISKIFYPHWQNEYQAALVELDPEKLSERVAAAETSIYKRLQQISQNSDHHIEWSSKTSWRAFAFSRGKSLGFLIGEGSSRSGPSMLVCS
jgi:hypothetical protein